MKPIKHIVSFSGGKDSTAMLLKMIENNMQIDDIIFLDTTVEFPEMYKHIDKVEKYIGRPITRLKAENDFEYMLLHYEKKKGKNKGQKGYSFLFQILEIDGVLIILKNQSLENILRIDIKIVKL
nr:MAG TPA: phosphoadenosine-phosphosulfate reductase [Ackermannviridae sp.]